MCFLYAAAKWLSLCIWRLFYWLIRVLRGKSLAPQHLCVLNSSVLRAPIYFCFISSSATANYTRVTHNMSLFTPAFQKFLIMPTHIGSNMQGCKCKQVTWEYHCNIIGCAGYQKQLAALFLLSITSISDIMTHLWVQCMSGKWEIKTKWVLLNENVPNKNNIWQ